METKFNKKTKGVEHLNI